MKQHLVIFDTTLRDGEQSPGCSMTTHEKVRFAQQLDHLGVDVIEAGFPAASEGDANAVRAISANCSRPVIADFFSGLALVSETRVGAMSRCEVTAVQRLPPA